MDNLVQIHQILIEKYHLLKSLLEEKVQGALVQARFIQLCDNDAPTRLLGGLAGHIMNHQETS